MEQLFDGTGVEFDYNVTDLILMDDVDLEYNKEIAEFVTKTSDVLIELYVWWMAIENMVAHTSSDIRDLKYSLYSLITGVEGSKVR